MHVENILPIQRLRPRSGPVATGYPFPALHERRARSIPMFLENTELLDNFVDTELYRDTVRVRINEDGRRAAHSWAEHILSLHGYSHEKAISAIAAELHSYHRTRPTHCTRTEVEEWETYHTEVYLPVKRICDSASSYLRHQAAAIAGKNLTGVTAEQFEKRYRTYAEAGVPEETLKQAFMMTPGDWKHAKRERLSSLPPKLYQRVLRWVSRPMKYLSQTLFPREKRVRRTMSSAVVLASAALGLAISPYAHLAGGFIFGDTRAYADAANADARAAIQNSAAEIQEHLNGFATPAPTDTPRPTDTAEPEPTDPPAETIQIPDNLLNLFSGQLYAGFLEQRIDRLNTILTGEDGQEAAAIWLQQIGGNPEWLTMEDGAERIVEFLDNGKITFGIVGRDVFQNRLDTGEGAEDFISKCDYTLGESNADQILVLTIDLRSNTVEIKSADRDLRVPSDGLGFNTLTFIDPSQSSCSEGPDDPAKDKPVYYSMEKMRTMMSLAFGEHVDAYFEFNIDGAMGAVDAMFPNGLHINIPEDLAFMTAFTLDDVLSDGFLEKHAREPRFFEPVMARATQEDQDAFDHADDAQKLEILKRQLFGFSPGEHVIFGEQVSAFTRSRKDLTPACASSTFHREARLRMIFSSLFSNAKDVFLPPEEDKLTAATHVRERFDNLMVQFVGWLHEAEQRGDVAFLSDGQNGSGPETFSSFVEEFRQMLVEQLSNEFIGLLGRVMLTQELPMPDISQHTLPTEPYLGDPNHPWLSGKFMPKGASVEALFSEDAKDWGTYFLEAQALMRKAFQAQEGDGTAQTAPNACTPNSK